MVSSGGMEGVGATSSVHDQEVDWFALPPPERTYAVEISGDSVKFTFDVSVTPDTSSYVCSGWTYDITVTSTSYIMWVVASGEGLGETITSANGNFEKIFTRSDNVHTLYISWQAEVTVTVSGEILSNAHSTTWVVKLLQLAMNYK
mgnify:FL=1